MVTALLYAALVLLVGILFSRWSRAPALVGLTAVLASAASALLEPFDWAHQAWTIAAVGVAWVAALAWRRTRLKL